MNDSALALAMDLAREFEGVKLKAYRCPAGVLTIGVGHTGPDVYEGRTITLDEAETLLLSDMTRAGEAVDNLVTVELNDNQAAALYDFVFNLGPENLHNSTLLRRLNKGDYDAVPAELMKWVYGGGKELPGLVRRRQAECELWATT